MWINRRVGEMLDNAHNALAETRAQLSAAEALNRRLEIESAKKDSLVAWMQLRLNAVEKERAQLIAAAIGVKISIPEFQPAQGDKITDVLSEVPDLSTVGMDAHEEGEVDFRPRVQETPIDYSQMPGYRAAK